MAGIYPKHWWTRAQRAAPLLLLLLTACSDDDNNSAVVDAGDTDTDTDSDPDDWDDDCGDCGWECWDDSTGPPPPGTPADLAAICSESGETVESNLAAKVSLNVDPLVDNLATGVIEIPFAIREAMVGEPMIEVEEATTSELFWLEVTELEPSSNGYIFIATWPDANLHAGIDRMVLKVTFELSCEDVNIPFSGIADSGQLARVVEAISYLRWCYFDTVEYSQNVGWATGDDICYDCGCTVDSCG